ncbi:protein-disulfide reductase DsbD domain-containing protein [Mesorhizobium sp. KR1-2]|uniref:protein-disulfide reductase DsbD domain-containing protein n=1 Tax=Mesorhizobium sp. KR1-2 TaxID=3156609 RepID=UPI0032B52341
MKTIATAALSLLAAATWSGPAFSSSTDWVEAQGGQVRLVTSGVPDDQGRLKGMLDIHLDPGWKTYWRDPGETGVPPSFDVSASSNVAAAEVSFPAPQRHDDGYSVWAGYDRSVALPITFHVAAPGQPAMIEADVFIGICETICIPVHAKLALDPASDPDNAGDAAGISAATEALPKAARPDFGVHVVSQDEKKLLVEAVLPGDATSAQFFLAGGDGYTLATPQREEKDGKTLFSVEILDRPTAKPAAGGLHYTLVAGNDSVRGLLPYP